MLFVLLDTSLLIFFSLELLLRLLSLRKSSKQRSEESCRIFLLPFLLKRLGSLTSDASAELNRIKYLHQGTPRTDLSILDELKLLSAEIDDAKQHLINLHDRLRSDSHRTTTCTSRNRRVVQLRVIHGKAHAAN